MQLSVYKNRVLQLADSMKHYFELVKRSMVQRKANWYCLIQISKSDIQLV